MTILNLMKMAESFQNRKHWEKEKLLITCNFSFSHSVFKSLVLQTCKNQGLNFVVCFVKDLREKLGLVPELFIDFAKRK